MTLHSKIDEILKDYETHTINPDPKKWLMDKDDDLQRAKYAILKEVYKEVEKKAEKATVTWPDGFNLIEVEFVRLSNLKLLLGKK